MKQTISLDFRDGELIEMRAIPVRRITAFPLGVAVESNVVVVFEGDTTIVGHLTPDAARHLFWQLAELYSPVSVSKLRVIAASQSKMAEKGADHVAGDDESPA